MRSRREFLKRFGSAALMGSSGLSAPLFRNAKYDKEDALRAKLATDPLRPQFHLLPAKNWMNDPNGPVYWNGKYHMFFQYNPHVAVWGDMHWAHASSPDMIHWRHLPVALAPSPDGPDADGCFTGSMIVDHGLATILYTGVKSAPPQQATLRDGAHNFREVQCLATSVDPELRTWRKFSRPVLQPPADPQLTGFRDPFLWNDGDTWYLGVGAGFRKQGGCVLLYRSHDLRQWEFLHPLASEKWTERESVNPVDSGEMWECPDFFKLGNKHVLLYSTAGSVIWEIGELDGKTLQFYATTRGILDHGAYYAQKTQLDSAGNRILWGWIPEKRPEAEFSAAGWAGCMALPRVLWIGVDGNLKMRVAPEAEALRGKSYAVPDASAGLSERRGAADVITLENLCAELIWKTGKSSSTFTLADGAGTWWSAQLEQHDAFTTIKVNGASFELPATNKGGHEFHLFIDGSVAELICAQQHAITTRIYRQPAGPLRVKLSDSELGQVGSLRAWQLRAISQDRLTT
jgi:beta-fructofuranosidase